MTNTTDTDVYLISRLTGHCRRGSAFSTDSDCGNCDGALCETCHQLFRAAIDPEGEEFRDKDAARAHGLAIFTARLALVFDGPNGLRLPRAEQERIVLCESLYFALHGDNLVVHFGVDAAAADPSSHGDGRYIACSVCDPAHPDYEALWLMAVERHRLWLECTDDCKFSNVAECQFEQCIAHRDRNGNLVCPFAF